MFYLRDRPPTRGPPASPSRPLAATSPYSCATRSHQPPSLCCSLPSTLYVPNFRSRSIASLSRSAWRRDRNKHKRTICRRSSPAGFESPPRSNADAALTAPLTSEIALPNLGSDLTSSIPKLHRRLLLSIPTPRSIEMFPKARLQYDWQTSVLTAE